MLWPHDAFGKAIARRVVRLRTSRFDTDWHDRMFTNAGHGCRLNVEDAIERNQPCDIEGTSMTNHVTMAWRLPGETLAQLASIADPKRRRQASTEARRGLATRVAYRASRTFSDRFVLATIDCEITDDQDKPVRSAIEGVAMLVVLCRPERPKTAECAERIAGQIAARLGIDGYEGRSSVVPFTAGWRLLGPDGKPLHSSRFEDRDWFRRMARHLIAPPGAFQDPS